ncbi:S1C family serine protease [Geomicrobium sp. JCM 19039]|uniref:S1C family serine protease n=1 Tax=Geomicrobium sp. JCM 19039 TaxID=1460636 RepID=UPI000694A572|nr:serine protease [Geomicrobium sp. JCM 19039]
MFQFLRPDVIDFLTTSYELSQNEEVAEWRESVVTLQVEAPGASSRGTGFFINEDGLIATNRHVVAEAFQVVATLHDGTAFQAEPVFISDELDFAIIDIGEQTPVPYLPLAEEEPIMDVGTDIIVIGNPLSFTGIANEGEVLETGTPAVISAPTFSGNSGSPAINHEGEVVGIIYATRNQGDEGRVGLMVPINEVIDEVTMIEEGGVNE